MNNNNSKNGNIKQKQWRTNCQRKKMAKDKHISKWEQKEQRTVCAKTAWTATIINKSKITRERLYVSMSIFIYISSYIFITICCFTINMQSHTYLCSFMQTHMQNGQRVNNGIQNSKNKKNLWKNFKNRNKKKKHETSIIIYRQSISRTIFSILGKIKCCFLFFLCISWRAENRTSNWYNSN